MASPMCDIPVKLGFVEEDTDLRLLRSHFFPSKVGGKPSWLSLDPLPQADELLCPRCNGPFIFLMQVYAPLQLRDDAFHRTLFLFVCPNSACALPADSCNFKVFRSQLPLINSFYSKDPPSEDLDDDTDMDRFPNAGHFQTLCSVCGCKGTKKCSQCKKAFYCGKVHQVTDWKGGHKKTCMQDLSSQDASHTSSIVFKELELVTEDEEVPEVDINNSKSEKECLEEYEQLMRLPQLQGLEGRFQAEDLEKTATAETEDDKQFLKFKRRIDSEPTQVLRYKRGGEPLWVSAFHKPTPDDIPSCSCGAPRIFEFQVMPQLLNYLSVDRLDASLDWGTLCVYTCKESCGTENTYKEEFIWKQDFHSNNQL